MTTRKKSHLSPPGPAHKEPTWSVASLAKDLGLTPGELLVVVSRARLEEDLEAAARPSSTTKDRKDADPAKTGPVQHEGPKKRSRDRRRRPTKSLAETYRSAMNQYWFVQEELERSMKASRPLPPSTPSEQQSPSSPSSSTTTRPSGSPAQDRT